MIELRPVERRLIAALAVCSPDAVRYDALADAVWGDAVPRSATRSLQTHVLRVRSAAGSDAVETVSGGYRLGATVSLDVVTFTTLFRAADASDSGRAAVAAWDETLTLWRGVPFEELDDWPPAIAERARLTEMWQRGLEERCAAALGVAATAEVVAEAEWLVQAEPLASGGGRCCCRRSMRPVGTRKRCTPSTGPDACWRPSSVSRPDTSWLGSTRRCCATVITKTTRSLPRRFPVDRTEIFQRR